MKSNESSPESEASLKLCLKDFKKEFKEHKEELLKMKEERVSLVSEVAELKQTLKAIKEYALVSKEKASQKNPKDIFSVVKSIAKALNVSKPTDEEGNHDDPPLPRPSTVVISHKCCTKKETWTAAAKAKRKLGSPTSSSELSSATPTPPSEKPRPQKSRVAFVSKNTARKKRIKMSYSLSKRKKEVKKGREGTGSDGLQESQ